MSSKVDLHIHTTVSDGVHSPENIVAKAAKVNMEYIAICDHDNLGGVGIAIEATRRYPKLRVIPGVEISTDYSGGDVHILGYFVDYQDPVLNDTLTEMRRSRVERARDMVIKLNGLGMEISWQRVSEIAGEGTVGRPHIATAMLEKGYIQNMGEAFDKYIGRGGPAYVERIKMNPEEAVRLVLSCGGIPVMAHPLTIMDHEPMVERLVQAGLMGLECHYGGFNPQQIDGLVKLAGKHHLLTTGGSDYHGLDELTETPIGGAEVPLQDAKKLIAKARQIKAKGLAEDME
ncbi:PHP domain-containing protein [Dehalococcoides mccartyi]|uniref:PHP domain N-terminal region family protein n=1 Tax=Dehalococcoides mccartyi (strain ATCC BAA-2266 / KCTC 15142 / 195) TaxID=243164 RepID=Q3Z644_DEHM1|nr:PHP domain-containing protein [Dehalococcoides mccartyi]AAW39110.1 PHP domain N-terminal region family protein [Dehalococcoides mccartyi 195]